MRIPRTAGVVLAVATTTLIFTSPAEGRSQSARHRGAHRDSAATQLLLSTINGMRARHHLHRYASNGKLARCALAHSVAMANAGPTGSLFHRLPGDACVRFVYASENIGYA